MTEFHRDSRAHEKTVQEVARREPELPKQPKTREGYRHYRLGDGISKKVTTRHSSMRTLPGTKNKVHEIVYRMVRELDIDPATVEVHEPNRVTVWKHPAPWPR